MTKTFDHPQIVVLDRGFVYAGRVQIEDGMLTITSAHCVRRWGTTKGLGELAATGPLENTNLDHAGTVHAPLTALVHMIDCAEDRWPQLAA